MQRGASPALLGGNLVGAHGRLLARRQRLGGLPARPSHHPRQPLLVYLHVCRGVGWGGSHRVQEGKEGAVGRREALLAQAGPRRWELQAAARGRLLCRWRGLTGQLIRPGVLHLVRLVLDIVAGLGGSRFVLGRVAAAPDTSALGGAMQDEMSRLAQRARMGLCQCAMGESPTSCKAGCARLALGSRPDAAHGPPA